MSAGKFGCLLFLFFSFQCPVALWAQELSTAPAKLSQEDKDFFEQLFRDGLFDPKDAVWTKLVMDSPGYASGYKLTRFEWKKGERFYRCNGASFTLMGIKESTPANFEEHARQAISQPSDQGNSPAQRRRRGFGFPGSIADPPDLAFAAWCYRQGKEQVALKLLADIRQRSEAEAKNQSRFRSPVQQEQPPADPRERLRWDLAWISYAGMVHSFQDHQDELALNHGEQLLKHFKEGLTRYPQAQEVIDDLKRRQKEGILGKPVPEMSVAARYGGAAPPVPLGYEKWSVEEKVKYWVKEFQEIDEPQMSQPGGVNLGNDFRVRAVVKLGEGALPALFDCLEKDTRLVRSVSYFRDFAPSREAHYVREAAWVAVSEILKSIPLEKSGVDYKTPKPERYRLLGAAAKKYWEANSGKSPSARWYETLCDLNAAPHLRFTAMSSLITDERYPRWTSGNDYEVWWPEPSAKIREIAAAFTNPTIAEAILKALDHDIAPKPVGGDRNAQSRQDRDINRAEDYYIRGLVALSDRRVLPELIRREAAAKDNFPLRLKLANAIQLLGDSKPLARLADDIALGKEPKEKFPAKLSDDIYDMTHLVASAFIRTLVNAKIPETEKALESFTKANHPLHEFFDHQLDVRNHDRFPHGEDFYSHPYCLVFYSRWLKDTTPSGITYRIERDSVAAKSPKFQSMGSIYGLLKDPQARNDSAESRVCDEVMLHLSRMIVGMPEYHPLLKDAQARFDRNLKWLDQYKFRHWTTYEAYQIGTVSLTEPLMPDVKPLGRLATAADVESGQAMFHFNGQGNVIDLKLPAWAVLKKDVQAVKTKDYTGEYVGRRGLIFQAEERGGKKHYGALFKDGIRALEEEELLRIEPYVPTSTPWKK
jgi:hypothetical protein